MEKLALAQELIDGVKDLVEQAPTLPIDQAVMVLLKARELDDKLKELKSQASELNKQMKEVVIPAKFDEAGTTSITVNGYRFTKSETIRASIKNKIAGYDWLRNNDLEDIITETVNASTLSATARTLMEEGRELPEDHFNVYILANTSVTKA